MTRPQPRSRIRGRTRLGAEERALQVDGQDLVPLLLGHLVAHRVAVDPGVVDEHVQPSELFDHVVRIMASTSARFVTSAPTARARTPSFWSAVDHRPRQLDVDVVGDDDGALPREPPRRRFADPAPRRPSRAPPVPRVASSVLCLPPQPPARATATSRAARRDRRAPVQSTVERARSRSRPAEPVPAAPPPSTPAGGTARRVAIPADQQPFRGDRRPVVHDLGALDQHGPVRERPRSRRLEDSGPGPPCPSCPSQGRRPAGGFRAGSGGRAGRPPESRSSRTT